MTTERCIYRLLVVGKFFTSSQNFEINRKAEQPESGERFRLGRDELKIPNLLVIARHYTILQKLNFTGQFNYNITLYNQL